MGIYLSIYLSMYLSISLSISISLYLYISISQQQAPRRQGVSPDDEELSLCVSGRCVLELGGSYCCLFKHSNISHSRCNPTASHHRRPNSQRGESFKNF